MTQKSKNSLLAQTTFEDIPDCWKSIHDIPQIEDMVKQIKEDPIFADSFFFQETNNPENWEDGTYQPLYNFQGYAFEVLDRNDVVVIIGARGSSKSSSFARWLDGYALRYPGIRAGLIAPSFRQSKQLHDYCVNYINVNSGVDAHKYKIESELDGDPKRGQEVIVNLRNTSLIEALPSGDGSKLRGRRYNVIGIDEAYQFQKEMLESHIMPMGNVKIGGRRTKLVYLTTSWYTDVYFYSVLQDVARQIAKGRPGYAIIDINLGDIIESGFPFDKKYILHQLESQSDPQTGKMSDELKMTFFNKWIRSSANFYTPSLLSECQRPDVPVLAKRPEKDNTPTVLGVDPAAQGENMTAMAVIGCPGMDERHLRAVYQFAKQTVEEIAGNIHKMVDLHGMKLILMDKSGILGLQVAAQCQKDTQLIDGIWQKRTPIYLWDHPDARNGRAHIVLTKPSDERMKMAVMGRRYDETISGEIDLKNTVHFNMKRVLQNGLFFAPKMIKDEDYYNSELGEIMDNIVEALAQFPKIDRKKNPDGKTLQTDARGNYYFTRPAEDDGAYSIIYANYAANIHYRLLEGFSNRGDVPGIWAENLDEKKLHEQHHQVILPRI